jgi:hypothetical protein
MNHLQLSLAEQNFQQLSAGKALTMTDCSASLYWLDVQPHPAIALNLE